MQQSRQDKSGTNIEEDGQNMLFQLQSDLLQTWSSLHVQEYYQNLVLNYLDTLPTYKVQQQITKQIKATNQGKSPYFKLSNNLSSRKQSLTALQGLINSNKKTDVDSQSLTSICTLMNSLRDSNLLFAETFIQLLRQYSLQQEPVSDECMQMFQNLDQDNRFLKESFLKDYVLFKQQYDPFFLHHYDMKGKKIPKKNSEIIDHLFALSLSYVCRLLKANNQIIQIVKQGKLSSVQNMESRLNSRRISQNLIKRKKATIQTQSPKEQKTKGSVNFRRRHFSLNQKKEKMFGESRTTFYRRDSLGSRKNSGIIPKQDNSEEYLRSIQFQEKGFQNNCKTQFEEKEERRFIPQNFRIKPIHPKEPFYQEKNKSTIINQQESPVTFKRKFNHIRNRLHPLKHFKKLYPQNSCKTQYEEEEQKNPASNCIPLLKREEKLLSIAKFDPEEKQPKQNQYQVQQQNIPKSVKKQIKMRPGKYDLLQTIKILKKLSLKKKSKDAIMSGSLQQCLRRQQSYVSEFLIDTQVQILAISVVLSHQVYLVKLWAVCEACSEQNSISLFKKYIDYLQKMTRLKQIHYEGQFIKQVQLNGFQQTKANYFVRSRVNKLNIRLSQFQPFLSLKCSNIVIQQENSQAKLFYSDDIQSFSKDNSYGCSNVIGVDKQKMNQNFKMIAKISQGIENMKTLNILLQDQNLDTYEVSNKTKISNIKAVRLNLNTSFAAPFLSSEGYLKFIGEMVQSSAKSTIYSVKCASSNAVLYFGKNMSNMVSFRQNLGKPKKEGCWFSVKMFSKQLYGRIDAMNMKQVGYGNWQINLSWQDELQGKIKHPMTNCDHFGPESFYVAVEIERQIVYCFQVNEKDFLL